MESMVSSPKELVVGLGRDLDNCLLKHCINGKGQGNGMFCFVMSRMILLLVFVLSWIVIAVEVLCSDNLVICDMETSDLLHVDGTALSAGLPS